MADHAVQPRKSRKKTFAILGVIGGIGVGGAAFALAAAGTATVTNVVVGQDDITSCDADGFTAELGQPLWDSASNDYIITTVDIVGLDTVACDAQVLQVDLTNGSDFSLANAEHTIVSGTEPGTLTLSASVSATAVEGLAAVIYDPGTP